MQHVGQHVIAVEPDRADPRQVVEADLVDEDPFGTDAQMRGLMRLELSPERATKLRSVLHYNGLPIDARSITDDILVQEGKSADQPVPTGVA